MFFKAFGPEIMEIYFYLQLLDLFELLDNENASARTDFPPFPLSLSLQSVAA